MSFGLPPWFCEERAYLFVPKSFTEPTRSSFCLGTQTLNKSEPFIYIYRYWQVDKPKMRWVCVKTIQNPDSLLLSPVFIRNGSIGGMPHPQISHSWDDKSSASWPSPIDHGPYNGIHPKYADSGHSILYNHTTMVNLGSSPYFSLWNTQQLPTTPNFV